SSPCPAPIASGPSSHSTTDSRYRQAGPAHPTPPSGWSAPWPAGPWAGQTQQVQTGEDNITGSWFKIVWLRNLSIYQEPSHITPPTRRSHPTPAKPDA